MSDTATDPVEPEQDAGPEVSGTPTASETAGASAQAPDDLIDADRTDVDGIDSLDADLEQPKEGEPDGEDTVDRSAKLAALDDEGDIAADYLEELLDIADLDGDIDTFTEGGRAHVSVVTDATVLVGKDGEVLEALQDLCRLAVITETGKRSRLMLDVAGHRDKRRRELTDLASDAVEEAKRSGEPVRLLPMNPFERKIVHDVVAAAGLASESDGEEPNRCVVVMPSR